MRDSVLKLSRYYAWQGRLFGLGVLSFALGQQRCISLTSVIAAHCSMLMRASIEAQASLLSSTIRTVIEAQFGLEIDTQAQSQPSTPLISPI